MAADDLSAPLGQETKRGRGLSTAIKASLPQAIATALATFLGAFVLWAVIADNPFGGEPMAVVQIARPARERGIAVGMASALPVSIERIAKWAKAAESRGLQLVPITAAASKAKQS